MVALVRYSLNRHTREATSTTSKFSRVPTEPGVFKVLSIAHQRNMCQTTVEGIEMEVHDIPAASVSKGGLTQDTIREGDQVSIGTASSFLCLLSLSLRAGHNYLPTQGNATVHLHLSTERASSHR